MPPKPKKKTPKQLLAEAELHVLALQQELQSTKKDYGEILSRMATANSELKGVVLKQELQLASSFDARELKLRLDLSQARLEIRDLKEIEKAGREARAAIETHEAERLHLQRQLAEAVGAREVMERAHATELLVYKQSVTKVTVGLEQKFKEQVGMMRESIRRDLAKEMGGDAMEAITQVIGLKALAARHARELAAAQLLLEEKEGENVRLRRSLVRLERMLLESEKTGVMEKESLRMAVETMRVKLGRAVALGASMGAAAGGGGGGGVEGPPLSPSSPSSMSSFASPTRPTSSSSYLPSTSDSPLERELQQEQQQHHHQQQQYPRSSPILSSPSTTSAYHTYRSPQAGSAEGGSDSRGGSSGDRQQRLDEKEEEEEEEDFSDIPPPPPPPPSQRPVRPRSAAPPSSLLSPPLAPSPPPASAEGGLPPLPLASLPSYDEGSNSSSGSSSNSSSNSGGLGAGDQRGERSPSGGVMSSPGGKSVTFAVQRPSSRGGVATTTTTTTNNALLESALGAASLPASSAPASSPIATSSNFSSSTAAVAAGAAGAAVYPLPSPSRLGNRPGSPSNSYRPMSNTMSTPTAATSFSSKRAAGSSSSSSSSFLPSSPSPSSPRSPFTVANAAALLTEAAYRAGVKMAAEGGGGGGSSPAKLNHFKTMEWGAT